MSVAALGDRLLDNELKQDRIRWPGPARRVQRAIARPTDAAWSGATAQDNSCPDAEDQARLPPHPCPRNQPVSRLPSAAPGTNPAGGDAGAREPSWSSPISTAVPVPAIATNAVSACTI